MRRSTQLGGSCSTPTELAGVDPHFPVADSAAIYRRDVQMINACGTGTDCSSADVLAIGQTFPDGAQLALDANYIYWAHGDGIGRAPRIQP